MANLSLKTRGYVIKGQFKRDLENYLSEVFELVRIVYESQAEL